MGILAEFRDGLAGDDAIARLRGGLIGNGVEFDGGFGPRRLLYADYVASGRALAQVEEFVLRQVLPFYANSHTEASHCGGTMTRLRGEARGEIARLTGAGADCHVVFTGSGATSGINRIVGLLDIAGQRAEGRRVTVLIGPYEHHSNILPWRESGAEVVEIAEASDGGVDRAALDTALHDCRDADMVIGAFSAASNVTGMLTDVAAVTRRLKAAGALALWDYAAGAPYLPMSMGAGDAAPDAIVFSPHKFPGGPAASGVMVVRDTIVRRTTPTVPGGGSVTFVSPWRHAYSQRVEAREEAGTPDIVGDIRAALCLLVKEAVSEDRIWALEERHRAAALAAWSGQPGIELLGQRPHARALPIFSFRIRDAEGRIVHHQMFTRMLSDLYGIQARGGCACAGPYAHRLLGLDRAASDALFAELEAGAETQKPGWVRLNFSYLHSDEEARRIIEAVLDLARRAADLSALYEVDKRTARFRPSAQACASTVA